MSNVEFTVKELLQMLEKTIADQLSNVSRRLDSIDQKLDKKASVESLVALESRVNDHSNRIGKLELAQASTVALSKFQRWLIGTVGVGLFSGLATLVWLAHG